MPRKPPAPVDTSRKLSGSKIWNGTIYSPGMENELPKDFPLDGPHWADWEDEENHTASVHAGAEYEETEETEIESEQESDEELPRGTVPELKASRPRKPRKTGRK